MKVLTIIGSPRRDSTSTAIAEKFNEEIAAMGGEVTTYTLNALDYKGCQGCYACKTSKDACVLKDDLKPVLEDMTDADVLVVTSPIYFGDITSQLKGMFDRFFSTVYADPDAEIGYSSRLPAGKKSLLIITQGAPDERHAEIPERYNSYFQMSGFSECRTIREVDRVDFQETAPYPESLKAAAQAARDFMSA